MIGDPAAAPSRTDLPFLRRRSRPRTVPPSAPAPAATGVSQPGTGAPAPRIDYTHPSRQRRPAAPSKAPSGAASSTGVDYTHRSTRPSTSAAQPGPASLDLSGPPSAPAVPSAPAESPASSLDLSRSPTPTERPAPAATPPRLRRAVRVTGRAHQLLTRASPTVTLTRVQSGVGQLTVEAIIGEAVGDLRLGAAYQLRSGGSSVLALALGRRFAPASGRRPVLIAGRENGYERIGVDLRQVSDIERLGILAFSEARQSLTWGGTLVVTTYGGARIELPLESLYPGTSAVLMSLYNVDGELVVRAEMETIAGDVREAARTYGYDRITWRDDRNPVD